MGRPGFGKFWTGAKTERMDADFHLYPDQTGTGGFGLILPSVPAASGDLSLDASCGVSQRHTNKTRIHHLWQPIDPASPQFWKPGGPSSTVSAKPSSKTSPIELTGCRPRSISSHRIQLEMLPHPQNLNPQSQDTAKGRTRSHAETHSPHRYGAVENPKQIRAAGRGDNYPSPLERTGVICSSYPLQPDRQ
jgi:hypothetical protein